MRSPRLDDGSLYMARDHRRAACGRNDSRGRRRCRVVALLWRRVTRLRWVSEPSDSVARCCVHRDLVRRAFWLATRVVAADHVGTTSPGNVLSRSHRDGWGLAARRAPCLDRWA